MGEDRGLLRRLIDRSSPRSDTMPKKRSTKRWVRRVTTDSTHPPSRTFTGSAERIARTMARKEVSGKGLSATRRRELERAKRILQRRAAAQKTCSIPFDSIYAHGFVREAVCVPSLRVADPHYNAERTLSLATRASNESAARAGIG